MRRPWRLLRAQLAVCGFLAIYMPVLILVGVSEVTETSVVVDGVEVTEGATTRQSPSTILTVIALAPVAAGLAWWLAGRAVRPIRRVRSVAEDIQGSDLSRRIGLDHGPTEIVALGTSFDSMLDRLEHAADVQRRLIEEASHQLRTPLALLSINADVVLADPHPTIDTYRQGVVRSKLAAVRLQATIDELLVDARGRARIIDRRPADLMAIARGVVEEARPLSATKAVNLSVTGPPAVECALDETTVSRALSNLVDNAIRFAPIGSAVEVVVEATDDEAIALVVDHGPGIPREDQEHIFERFWRSHSDPCGTGLGLPIAKQTAVAHGGALTVQSPGPTGDGCAFELRLRR